MGPPSLSTPHPSKMPWHCWFAKVGRRRTKLFTFVTAPPKLSCLTSHRTDIRTVHEDYLPARVVTESNKKGGHQMKPHSPKPRKVISHDLQQERVCWTGWETDSGVAAMLAILLDPLEFILKQFWKTVALLGFLNARGLHAVPGKSIYSGSQWRSRERTLMRPRKIQKDFYHGGWIDTMEWKLNHPFK